MLAWLVGYEWVWHLDVEVEGDLVEILEGRVCLGWLQLGRVVAVGG